MKVLNENNYKKAVATSTERHRVEKLLLEANLIHNFDAIICGDEVENGKPEPEIFIKAAQRLGLAPEECLVLEDSPYGVLAAWKCGAKPVLIPDRIQPPAVIEAIVYRKLSSLMEVIPLLTNER